MVSSTVIIYLITGQCIPMFFSHLPFFFSYRHLKMFLFYSREHFIFQLKLFSKLNKCLINNHHDSLKAFRACIYLSLSSSPYTLTLPGVFNVNSTIRNELNTVRSSQHRCLSPGESSISGIMTILLVSRKNKRMTRATQVRHHGKLRTYVFWFCVELTSLPKVLPDILKFILYALKLYYLLC